MIRRTVTLAAVACAAVVALIGPAAAATGDVTIRQADVTEFPNVRLVVSMADPGSLERTDVRVFENGFAVDVTAVHPLGAKSGAVDAVLAIDASNSMRGEPLVTALAAARTFLAGVPTSMPLGVVTFSDQTIVLSPVSDDRAAVEAAVASLAATTSQGTALFNAVAQASAMFSGPGQHNLILLTDGRCRADPSAFGPCTLDGSLEEAVAAANDAGVAVFTIGLSRTGQPVPTLDQMARLTGGTHSLISIDELEGVYAGLAQQFARQYVVEYRSKAPLGAPVTVEVRVPVGRDDLGFLAPGHAALPTDAEAASQALVFWTTPLGMALVAGITFVAALAIALGAANVVATRRRVRQLRSTVGAPVETASTADGAAETGTAIIPRHVADVAESVAGRVEAGRRLARRLEHAGWSIRSGEFLLMVAAAVVVLTVVGFLAANVVGALAGLLGAGFVPFGLLSHAAARRQAAIQAQLADTLMIIASSMRAGHSFMQSLDSAAKEADDPASTEFGRVLREIRLGRDTDGALDAMVERVGSQDLEWAVTAIKIQRKIGGNLAEVLETVAKTIRERETLRRQVKVLSAEGRISIVVLTVLPVLIAGYIMLVNPEYLRTLTTTRLGITLSSGGLGLMVVGYIWMKKIVKLDV